jgi:hypothetical protein
MMPQPSKSVMSIAIVELVAGWLQMLFASNRARAQQEL